MGSGKNVWGYYPTTPEWKPIKVDSSGRLVLDPSLIFEDTPTDGETKKAPTSNWAYDHAADTAASQHTAGVGKHAHGADTEAAGGMLTSPFINEAVAMSVLSTDLNLVDDIDFVMEVHKRSRFLKVQTSGWYTGVAGSGSVSQEPSAIVLNTGVNASSEARVYCRPYGLIKSGGFFPIRPDWSQKIAILADIGMGAYDTEAVSYFHYTTDGTHKAADTPSVGLKLVNNALYGESYGASGVATVNLGLSLTYYQLNRVLIVHDPSVPQIDWYVDTGSGLPSTPTGSQTTSGNIPQAQAGTDNWFTISLANGVTGGNYCQFYLFSSFFGVNAS